MATLKKKHASIALNPEAWLDSYGDLMFAYALTRVRNKTLAEDLVQEALLAALKTAHTFRGDSKESTWLVGVLQNKILDHLRKSSREHRGQNHWKSILELEEDQFDDRGNWVTPVQAWASPEKSSEQAEFWPIVNHCIAELPEKLSTLFILREFDGMDTEQIAGVLDISTKNNLWVMLSRARQRMRHCLQNNWFDNGNPR